MRAGLKGSTTIKPKKKLITLLSLIVFFSGSPYGASAIYGGTESINNRIVVGLLGNQFSTVAGCSGGLVAPQVVFTAAHCVYGSGAIWVAAPGSDLRDLKTTRIESKAIYLPKDFTTATFPYKNDFAVILLKSKFSDASIVPIATSSQIFEWINNSAEVMHVGYGCTKLVDSPPCGVTSPIPNQFSTTLVNEIPPQFASLTPGTFSMTRIAVEKTICGGDSGSPLLKNVNGTWIYLGAQSSSNGAGCTKTCNTNCVASQGLASSNTDLIQQIASYLEIAKTEPTPTPSTSGSSTSTNSKKQSTIRCIKGKAVKKITAIDPKCPKGYKKK